MKSAIKWGAVLAALLAALSCTSTGGAGASGRVLPETMRGIGRDMSAVTAIHRAKIDVINRAVFVLLGEKQYQLYEPQLRIAILNTTTPDEFIYRETIKNIDMVREGEFFRYELEMKVNWRAIEQTVTRQGVVLDPGAPSSGTPGSAVSAASTPGTTGSTEPPLSPNAQRARDLVRGEMGTPTSTGGTTAAPSGSTTPQPTETEKEDWGEATAEEASIIRRYVDTMTYMVYYGEESKEDPALLRAAAAKANEFLASRTMEAIDIAQVEKIKADQKKVFEESTGNDVTFIQWIAQKLNADVYIEIDASSTGRSAGTTRHYGSVNLNIKLYDPSTAQLLGAVPFNSEETFSTVSQLDAKVNALQSSLFRILPKAIEQAKNYMTKALTRGIKYELILQNTSDSRLLSRFRTALARRVKAVNVVTSTPQETRYEVYYIGMTADLEDLIYQVTDTIPGLEGMNKVMQRGKSLTMDTGL